MEEDRVRERRGARESAAQLQTQLTEARAEAAGIEEAHEARTRELETIRKTLEERFEGAALAALKTSNDEFRKQAEDRFRQERAQADERFQRQRELAAQDLEARRTAVDDLVKPLGENLTRLDRKVAELERARTNGSTKPCRRRGGRSSGFAAKPASCTGRCARPAIAAIGANSSCAASSKPPA